VSLVELARYASFTEAELDRGRLESAGIYAVCFDGGMNIAEGLGLMIPTRLMVLDEDADNARAVLAPQP
jgi:hypothetical protein